MNYESETPLPHAHLLRVVPRSPLFNPTRSTILQAKYPHTIWPQPPQKLNEQNMSCGLYLGGVVVGPGGQLDDAALAPDQRVPELVAAHTHGAHGTDARDHNLRIHKTHEPSGADSRHAEGLEFRGVASCRALRYTTKAADLFYSSTEQNGPLG